MIFDIFLLVLVVLSVTSFVLAFTNPDAPRIWALCCLLGGFLNTLFLMTFFLLHLCWFGVVLNCPVVPA